MRGLFKGISSMAKMEEARKETEAAQAKEQRRSLIVKLKVRWLINSTKLIKTPKLQAE
jgi:hypothetical protein